jgi:hypothetical protein
VRYIAFALVTLAGCGGQQGSSPPASLADDTTMVQAAVDQGGVVSFEARTYHLTKTIVVRKSNTTVQGAGAATVFEYAATANRIHCVNDRVFTTPCDGDDALPRRIAQPIAIGDYSFTATDDASDLQSGEWLLINDYDSVYADRAAVDWVQVASVAGNMVTVTEPFRMAFTTARPWVAGKSGLGFTRIPLVENLEFRNFAISVPTTTDPDALAAGLSIFMAKHVIVDHVQVNDAAAQALYSYISKDVTFTNCAGTTLHTLNEFGSTVDLTLENNTFSSADGAGLGLDLGTGFFTVSNNTIEQSKNIGAYMLYGVHDGLFDHNHIAHVPVSDGFNAVGIMAWGVQNVAIAGNVLDGGDGTQSKGISVRGSMGEVYYPALNVTVSGNTFGSWAMDYEPGTVHQ